MTFGEPLWFWGFLLGPVLIAFFLRNEARREVLLRKLVATRLLANLSASASTPRRRWKFVFALLGILLVVAALTEPRLGEEIQQSKHHGLDLLIAIDTSKSMLSTDVQPDRLTRAKFAVQDLLDTLEGDRAGLVAFAGTAFVQAPLTIDYSAVQAALQDIDTNTIPRGGTNIAAAILQAADAFGKGESTNRALVLFTDGEELEDNAVAAAKALKGQFRIFTVGVGTPAGSLIPTIGADGGTEFQKDDQGQFVKSRLDEAKLKEIAEVTGGFYIHLDNGPAAAKAIVEQGLAKMQTKEYESQETKPIERYEWPLAAGILSLLASMLIRERRPVSARRQVVSVPSRAAVVAGFALAMLMPARSHAANEGLNLYNEKDFKGAYDVFGKQLQHNPESDGLEFDQGASAYKEGDYDKALRSFGQVLGSSNPALRGQAEYNIGNTLVQHGALQQEKDQKIKEFKEALKHYDEALKVDPKNPDATYNEDVVRKMIEELEKPPQQQQKDQQKDQQNQQSQSQQQQQQNQQSQSQQNQQAQNQQQQNQQSQSQQNQQAQNQPQQNQQSQSQQNQQAQNQPQQNQQSQSQQNQQAQNQPQQNQQSQSQQDQQAQNQPPQNQQGQSPQDQQAQNQPPQNQQGQSPQDQNGRQGPQGQQLQAANSQGSPSPTPGTGAGELKENSQQAQKADANAAARAATEAAKAGEMTPSQAQALIDSLRGEDEHVSLYDREQNNNELGYKDW